ncbi:hypothetical protein FOBRF1_002971 [Fusarium oxysporum]
MNNSATIDLVSCFLSTIFSFLFLSRIWWLRRVDNKTIRGYYGPSSLALARAIYARCEIVLLDDSFSALDHKTEREVVSNLVGTQGHFQVFKLLVQAMLLFSAQKLLTVTLPICVLVVYVVQRVYLRTSRQLRLLQLESQSAVYSSFLESRGRNAATVGWKLIFKRLLVSANPAFAID